MKNKTFFSLNTQIALGAVSGLMIGIWLNKMGSTASVYSSFVYLSDIVGRLFIDLLKMILIPLVFTSIVTGIANLQAHHNMDRVWKTTLVYFFSTTALAIVIALIVVNVFKPGVGLNLAMFQDSLSGYSGNQLTLAEFIKSFFADLFVNPITAMAKGNVLATVIFALFLGVALVVLKDRSQKVLELMNQAFDVIMLMVQWIMKLAPLGIMALLIKLVATQELGLLSTLSKFVACVVGTTLFHGFIVLPSIYWIFTKKNPFDFLVAIREAMFTALSTSSSSATLPVTLRCVEQNLKVDKNIAGFVCPLGATVNMDGTAIYESMAALFVANLAGIHLNLVQQLIVFAMAMLASIGAPGIPSAGMVTMIMVLQSVGLPVEAIAILLPIDRPLDTIRTAVNVEGDMVGSAIVDKIVNYTP